MNKLRLGIKSLQATFILWAKKTQLWFEICDVEMQKEKQMVQQALFLHHSRTDQLSAWSWLFTTAPGPNLLHIIVKY